jgi:tetratricopeptide (TPR) repeat protein
VLGVVARLRGQPDEARRTLLLSLAAARTARRRDMVGRALFNLAAIAHEQGDLDRAERLYDDAIGEMRPIGDGFGIARVLHSLGKIHFHRCEADEAMALFLESVALRRRLGDAQGAANSEHSYAHVLLSLGRTAEARELLQAALRATAELGERRSRGHYLDSLGMIALVEGDVVAADGYLAEADEIAGAIDLPALRAEVELHRALAHLARGDLAAARRMAGPPCGGTGRQGAGGAGPGGTDVPAPEPDGSPLALERCAVTACVALASGDHALAARQAAAMGLHAAASGFALEVRAARRIAAAVEADAADQTGPDPVPDATRYPRLIWVSDETSALELPVRDASLTQT